MKKKYKLTGFARLFIFMIFFLPITFTAANYIKGENPLDMIKKKIEGIKSNTPNSSPFEASAYEEKITTLEKQIDKLETELMLRDAEIKALKDVVKKQ